MIITKRELWGKGGRLLKKRKMGWGGSIDRSFSGVLAFFPLGNWMWGGISRTQQEGEPTPCHGDWSQAEREALNCKPSLRESTYWIKRPEWGKRENFAGRNSLKLHYK